MKKVVIESPFAGDFFKNRRYVQFCMLHCLKRGEAPFPSHALYPQVLNDRDERERELGMQAGFAWGAYADICAIYVDLGFSKGMVMGAMRAAKADTPVEFRHLPPDLFDRFLDNEDLEQTIHERGTE